MDDHAARAGQDTHGRTARLGATEESRAQLRFLLHTLAVLCLVLGPAGCLSGVLSDSYGQAVFEGAEDRSYRVNYTVGITASLGLPTLCIVISLFARQWAWAGLSALLYLWPVVVTAAVLGYYMF